MNIKFKRIKMNKYIKARRKYFIENVLDIYYYLYTLLKSFLRNNIEFMGKLLSYVKCKIRKIRKTFENQNFDLFIYISRFLYFKK